MPAFSSSRAVPPVEMISIAQVGEAAGELTDAGLVGDRQKRSGNLDLAGGDGRRRRHGLGALVHVTRDSSEIAHLRAAADDHPPGVLRIGPHGSVGDEADRLGQQFMLDRVQPIEHVGGIGRLRELDRALENDGAAVDPVINEVDGDAEHLDPVVDPLLNGGEARERRQQGRVDVDDALWEPGQKPGTEQLHVAGEDDEFDAPLDEPLGDRGVPGGAAGVGIDREDRCRHPGGGRPFEGARAGFVRGDSDDRDPVPPVHAIEQRLEVRARSGGEDADVHVSIGAGARSFGNRPPLEVSVPAPRSSSIRPSTSPDRRWANEPYSGSSS